MSLDELAIALGDALAAIGKGDAGVDLASVEELRQRVLDSVRALPGIEPYGDDKGTMLCFAGGWRRMTATEIAQATFQRAKVAGADAAMAEVRRFLAEDHFEVKQSLLLTAARIETPLTLSNGIMLEPFDGSKVENARYIPGIPSRDHRDVRNITAAITKRHLHPIILGTSQQTSGAPPMQRLWDFEDLEDARLCLSLIGPSGPATVSTSIQTVDWLPGGGGALGQHPVTWEIRHSAILTDRDARDLQDIHRKFVELDAKLKRRLRVAMRRLNMSMRRRWDVDTAIDLGNAIELLFYDDPPEQSTIGFLIRLRAARLLRQTLVERKTLANLVKRMYKIRSSAAHKGVLPSDSEDVMQEGAKLVAEAIRTFIERGEPDWEAIEFG